MPDVQTYKVTLRIEGKGRNMDVFVQARSKSEARQIAAQQNPGTHVVMVTDA